MQCNVKCVSDFLHFVVFQKANTGKKQFKRRDGDRFDSLVEQYKKKLMGNGDKNTDVRKNKWFDS